MARKSLAQRFWEKVDRTGGIEACWPWLGYVNPNGYGYFRVGPRVVRAHRVALALAGIPLAEGEEALHECDNRVCCNPFCPEKHLKPGSHGDNIRDSWKRTRRQKHYKYTTPARELRIA